MNNKILGNLGEEFACEHAKSLGMVILEKNFRGSKGELDFIAQDEDTVVFAEVKTRSGNKFGTPAEAVSSTKIERIKHTATEYVVLNPLEGRNVRFDVVEVYKQKDGFKLNYIKNAF